MRNIGISRFRSIPIVSSKFENNCKANFGYVEILTAIAFEFIFIVAISENVFILRLPLWF